MIRRRRQTPLAAFLTIVAGAALLCLLFIPARDESNLRMVLDWRPEIEPLLLIGLLALLALAGRSLPRIMRWLLAVVVFLAALWQLADAQMLGIFDRDLNLYLDLPLAPSALALFYQDAPWRSAALGAGALLGSVALVAVIAHLLRRFERALAPPAHALACLAAVVTLALVAYLPVGSPAARPVAARTAPVLAHQIAQVYRAFAVMNGYDHRYAPLLAAPQPPAGPLPGLKRHDVYLVFFESYGTVVLDNPSYAAVIEPALSRFAATIGAAGYHLRSGRIVSPTFGGGSWIAHGTMDSGLKLDPFLARLIAKTPRRTWAQYMAAAGYRTVEVMPGLKTPAPENAYWAFEKSYYAADLGYDGPPFGWFHIPDQYTLKRFEAAEDKPGHAPLFAQLVLVSSHTPFAPVPPYVADWDDAGPYRSITQAVWDHIYAPPDWAHLDRPYLASVVYDLDTLGAWLARRSDDALVIILGDHQPPGFVSGEKQPWTVPIHVLARDPEMLRPFADLGYAEGPLPPPADAPVKGMESFLGDFLAAYSQAPARLAQHPLRAENVAD